MARAACGLGKGEAGAHDIIFELTAASDVSRGQVDMKKAAGFLKQKYPQAERVLRSEREKSAVDLLVYENEQHGQDQSCDFLLVHSA